ncbi:MAG: hypothetical protein IRY99_27555, partial [Isosphaeraceae bacterium]|nr:hypothetical protein [Isosphaeraceae bacterium]
MAKIPPPAPGDEPDIADAASLFRDEPARRPADQSHPRRPESAPGGEGYEVLGEEPSPVEE